MFYLIGIHGLLSLQADPGQSPGPALPVMGVARFAREQQWRCPHLPDMRKRLLSHREHDSRFMFSSMPFKSNRAG